jgi:hypothetical protein
MSAPLSAPPSAVNSPNIPAQNPSIPPLAEIDGSTMIPMRPVQGSSGSGSGSGSDVDTMTGERFNREHPLFEDLAPEDSYLDGVYWVSRHW